MSDKIPGMKLALSYSDLFTRDAFNYLFQWYIQAEKKNYLDAKGHLFPLNWVTLLTVVLDQYSLILIKLYIG